MPIFRSENRPLDFAYHDSEWALVSGADGAAVLSVKHLNLRADAPQNPFGCDMELAGARVSLRGIRILRGCFYGFSGEIACAAPEAAIRLQVEAVKGFRVLSLERRGENRWLLTGTNETPYFEAELAWDSLAIEWNDYTGPAYYERRHNPIQPDRR